jgi:tagatose 6-phosphate kinase
MADRPHVLTVTLNLAQDVTYRLPHLEVGESNAVLDVKQRAGGKGINVARVLRTLGVPVRATGLAGGPVGDAVRADLDAAGIDHRFVPVAGETRRTVAVVDERDVTVLNEPGPVVTPAEWQSFLSAFDRLLEAADAVSLSGSLPRGLPVDAYATLIRRARAAGRPCGLDTSGPALRGALDAHPSLVKVNAREAREVLGADPVGGVRRLLASGIEVAAVSAGEDGMVAGDEHGVWHVQGPRIERGNPTGAGDAAMAALMVARRDGTPLAESLASVSALAATSVSAEVAGEVDPDLAARTTGSHTVRAIGD